MGVGLVDLIDSGKRVSAWVAGRSVGRSGEGASRNCANLHVEAQRRMGDPERRTLVSRTSGPGLPC